MRTNPKTRPLLIGLFEPLSFRKNRAKPIIAKNQIPIGSNAELARTAETIIVTIAALKSTDLRWHLNRNPSDIDKFHRDCWGALAYVDPI